MIGLSLWIPNLLAQDLKPEEMREDLRIFRDGLERFHPEMHRYTDQESFEKRFSEIESVIKSPMDQRDFYKLLRPVLVDLKDGHVKWIVRGKDQHYGFFTEKLFPLHLYFEGERVKVLGNFGGEEVPALAEVKSINGMPIEAIRTKLLAGLTYGDGDSQGGKYYQLNRFFAAYFSTEFGVGDVYSVELLSKGKTLTWEGKGISNDQIESKSEESDDPFAFKITNGRTGILDINRFFSYKGEPNFKKFLKNTFETLSDDGISDLILDLRGNEGGNEKLGIELYRYLAQDKFRYYDYVTTKPNQKVEFEHYTSKIFRIANSFSKEKGGKYLFTKAPSKVQRPHKNAFSGNLIVLLDGQSFSVAPEFASRVQSDRRATIIGEETAGGAEVNSSGFFTILTLPHSHIDLGIPRLGFHMADLGSNMDKNRGIVPDQIIIPSAEDILNGKDPVMEKALELVVRLR